MSGRHRIVLALCLSVGVISAFALWQPGARRQPEPPAQGRQTFTGPKTGEEFTVIGGVRRPAHSVAGQKRSPEKGREPSGKSFVDLIGKTPAIPKDANPMVKSMVAAIETKKFPERLSSLIQPKAFDAEAYRRSPQSYLDIVEPGRVFQPAQPGEGVPRLEPISPPFLDVQQKETVSLKVKAIPNAPVTFTSFDLGAFQNQLTSITVAAGDDGIAIARFTGTPGTFSGVNILAASPLTSGHARFVVDVLVAGVTDGSPSVSSLPTFGKR